MASAAQADDRDAILDLLGSTEELAGLKDVVAKLNPIAGGYHYGVDIFGAKADLYVYFPDGPVAAPVAAVLLPSVALSTIVPPLKDTAADIRLDKPMLIAALGGYLSVAKMPEPVKARAADVGFTSSFHVEKGFNTFGLVANHGDLVAQVLKIANLPGPLVAGYASPSGAKIDDPKKPDKKKKLSDVVVSLSLPANASWREPFFLKDTEIERASVQFRKPNKLDPDPKTQLRVNGRGRIGKHAPKEYDLFLEKTFGTPADAASLGMLVAVNPTAEVELTDFFAVTQALWATLGFPDEMAQGVLKAGHALPLDQVKLRNPYSAKEAFPEEGGYPDFDKVMFAGANPAAEIPGRGILGKLNKGPLLTVNADAKVFGFDAAGLEGALSVTHGLKLDAKAKLPKLGPITVADAAFDTTVNAKEAFMKLHVDAATVGKFDVDAGKDGLSFEISPQCPDKPVGLVASLSGFDLSKDFSVKPQMRDCLTPIIKALIEGGEKAVEVAGEIAGEAAGEAADIAKTAEDNVAKFAKDRAATWANAIASKTHADQALNGAKSAVAGLEGAINDLSDRIDSVTRDIDKLLRKVWALVKGEVKDKKKDRQHLIADRDNKRTELAAAKQRKQQAEEAEAQSIVPYLDADVRDNQAKELGARVLAAQQTRFADQAKALPDTLKTLEGRKALLDGNTAAARAEAAFVAENGTSLNGLIANFGSLDAVTKAAPSAEGVVASAVGARLDAIKEEILREEVPKLPTMAFDKKVLVQTAVNGATLCLTQRNPYDTNINIGLLLKVCDGSAGQELIFHDTGVIEVPASAIPAGWNMIWGPRPCLGTRTYKGLWTPLKMTGEEDCRDGGATGMFSLGTRFFYDPLDGMIRFGESRCLNPHVSGNETAVVNVMCPGTLTADQIAIAKQKTNEVPPDSIPAWTLVDSEQFKKQRQQGHATALAAGPLRGVAAGKPAGTKGTNLAPLALD